MKSSKRFFALTVIIIITSTFQANTEPTKEAQAQVHRTFDLMESSVPPLSLFQKGKIAGESLANGAMALFLGTLAYGGVTYKEEKLKYEFMRYTWGAFFAYAALKFAESSITPVFRALK